MIKFACLALSAALGVAGLVQSQSAGACPAAGAAVAPVVLYPIHARPYYVLVRDWHRQHERFARWHRDWDHR